MNIMEFLLARIAEDESAAREFQRYESDISETAGWWEPTRVLAECTAKRAIVELFRNGVMGESLQRPPGLPTKRRQRMMPKWMEKYPCPSCGAGYGQCHEGALSGSQCCQDCRHPDHTLAKPHPWTADELEEMWSGREMPEYVAREVAMLRD